MPKPHNRSQKEDNVIIKKPLRMRKSLHCAYSQIHLLILHNDMKRHFQDINLVDFYIKKLELLMLASFVQVNLNSVNTS